jgi:hypothetical protein
MIGFAVRGEAMRIELEIQRRKKERFIKNSHLDKKNRSQLNESG